MTQEALKLALEKIATVNAMDYEYQAWAREALAQEQEQEPVACDCNQGQVCHICDPITPPQRTEQEPMSWHESILNQKKFLAEMEALLVKTSTPQRTWVGLTDEERSQLVTLHHGWNEYAQAIEAKLKEKNT
jgi:hypothetical protein